MHQMLALALQSDSTRSVTLKSTAMNDVPKLPGVDTGWHDLSHHGQDEQKIDELKLIEEAKFREINALLVMLRNAKEAGHRARFDTLAHHQQAGKREQPQRAGSAGDSCGRWLAAWAAHHGRRQRQRQRPPP